MIERLENQIETATKAGLKDKVTVFRGRLIRELKCEINKLKDKGPSNELTELQSKLDENIRIHDEQLAARYKDEFLNKDANLESLVTMLPKGVALSVERVLSSINNLKISKSSKEKIYNALNVAKSVGLVGLTPIIYGTKFAVHHWYVFLAALGILKLTDFELVDKVTDNIKFGDVAVGDVLDDIKSMPVVKQGLDGMDYVGEKIFNNTSVEDLKNIDALDNSSSSISKEISKTR